MIALIQRLGLEALKVRALHQPERSCNNQLMDGVWWCFSEQIRESKQVGFKRKSC